MLEQDSPDSMAARLGTDEQILEIEAAAGEESREVVEEERETDRDAVELREHDLGAGTARLRELARLRVQRPPQVVFGGDRLVAQTFVLRELADEGQDGRQILGLGAAQPQVGFDVGLAHARFLASSSSRVFGQSPLRSCERARSASSLPPVWQVGQ